MVQLARGPSVQQHGSFTRSRGKLLGALAVVPFVVACSGYEGGYEDEGELFADESGSLEQAITGGALVTAADNTVAPFSSAVLLNQSCSGVKIADKRFLTAAHCISSFLPTTIRIANNLTGAQGSPFDIAPGTLARHPSYELGTNAGEIVKPGLYDVAVFSILDPLNFTGPIIATPLTLQATPPGTTNMTLVAYGCDSAPGSTNGGKKQKAVNAFTAISNANLAAHVHYIKDSGGASVCSGDSGSPLFRNSVPRVTGIAAHGTAGVPDSSFTRVANVAEWIAEPAKNVFLHNSTGFLMNGAFADGSFPALRCASIIGKGPAIDADVRLDECDDVDATVTGNPPGWRLLSTGGINFAIVNRSTGTCLGVLNGSTADNADVRAFSCDAVTPSNIPTSQRWSFANPSGSYFRVVNQASQRCLGTSSGTGSRLGDVRQFTCGSSSNLQWVFTR